MSKPLAPERLLLLKAADEMEKRGHCKGDLSDEQGRVCLVEAMGLADDAAAYKGAKTLLLAHLGLQRPFGHIDWNNAPERTGEEVIAALRGAAMHGL